MCREAYAFRGEYIDVCSQLEQWALELIAKSPDDRKPQHLFGQKLKQIGELAADDTFFRHPARVRALLVRLEPFAKLRSNLAHAVAQTPNQASDPILAFELPGALPPPDDTGRFWFRLSDTTRLLADLKKIKKELADQKLKADPMPKTTAPALVA